MERTNSHGEYIATLKEALKSEAISSLDFDQLRSWLDQIEEVLSRVEQSSNEAALLRDDYRGRIGGMVKAIAAVQTRRQDYSEALEQIESLEGLTATELLAQYRLVSARFRDAFPTSFGLARQHGRTRTVSRPHDFK